MLLENLLSHFVILHAQANDRFAVQMRNERIEIINIQFRLEQRRDESVNFPRGVHFSDDEQTLSKRETFLHQQIARFFGIIQHQSDDGTVRRVENRQRQDMNLMGGED